MKKVISVRFKDNGKTLCSGHSFQDTFLFYGLQ